MRRRKEEGNKTRRVKNTKFLAELLVELNIPSLRNGEYKSEGSHSFEFKLGDIVYKVGVYEQKYRSDKYRIHKQYPGIAKPYKIYAANDVQMKDFLMEEIKKYNEYEIRRLSKAKQDNGIK